MSQAFDEDQDNRYLDKVLDSEFTNEQDRAFLTFFTKKAHLYGRHEIFVKAKELVPILSGKTVKDLHSRYHNFLFPLVSGKQFDETECCFTVEQDRDLLVYIIDNAKNFDRWEIFLKAQENQPSLQKKTVLELYLRYHRYLFPLFTGKLSNENAGLETISTRVTSPTKITVVPRIPAPPLSESGSETDSTSSNESSLGKHDDLCNSLRRRIQELKNDKSDIRKDVLLIY